MFYLNNFILTVFKPDELKQALTPTLKKLQQLLNQQNVDALAYRQLLNPKPMGLSTIRQKLSTKQYSDPWEFIDDVHLMLDNARLFNRKTSRADRCWTKVNTLLLSF